MSSNTQIWRIGANRVESPLIRAGALLGPLETLFTEEASETARIKKQLKVLGEIRSAESLIDGDDYLETLERMEALASKPDLILRTAISQDFTQIGILGKAVVHAETLWEGLVALKEGMKYFTTDSSFTFRLRNGRCRISYMHPFGDHPAVAIDIQYTFALLYNVVSETRDFAKADVTLGYPSAKPEHWDIFPAASKLQNAREGHIEFNDALLRSPMRRSDAYIAALCKATVAKFDIKAMEVPSASELVQHMQVASFEHSHCPLSLADAAKLMDMPERSLQAQLKGERTSFTDLRQRVMHETARRELLAGRSIEHTSEMLGFSQRQSFSGAFSKWEGTPPSEFASRYEDAPE